MTKYRYLPFLEQHFVESIRLPARTDDVPDELVSMIVSQPLERIAPSDHVKEMHSPARERRRQ